MVEDYKIVYEGGSGEIVEKKSRFIATVLPVTTEEEAQFFIEKMKKKYWDARHNCSAYVIGERQEICRCSDDGEPSQPAGNPMLEVLLGEELHNVVVVVTRYFGGTLLGTGGLVRAYSKAVKAGLEESVIVNKHLGKKIHINTDYNSIGKIQYIAAQMEISFIDTQYTDSVDAYLMVPIAQVDGFVKKIIEATSGKAEIEYLEEIYYTFDTGEMILFE